MSLFIYESFKAYHLHYDNIKIPKSSPNKLFLFKLNIKPLNIIDQENFTKQIENFFGKIGDNNMAMAFRKYKCCYIFVMALISKFKLTFSLWARSDHSRNLPLDTDRASRIVWIRILVLGSIESVIASFFLAFILQAKILGMVCKDKTGQQKVWKIRKTQKNW